MKKINLSLRVIFSLAIAVGSLPLITKSVKAVTTQEQCVSIVDDFSSISGNWSIDGGNATITDGKLNIFADEPIGTSDNYNASISFDVAGNEMLDFPLNGDWTLTFDSANLSSDNTDLSGVEFALGSDLIKDTDEDFIVDGLLSIYLTYEEGVQPQIVVEANNGGEGASFVVLKTEDVDVSALNSNLSFRYVKVGSEVTMGYSIDNGEFIDLYTYEIDYVPYFRFFLSAVNAKGDSSTSATIDNFTLTCEAIQTQEFMAYPTGTVYRYLNNLYGSAHFYTIDATEAELVIDRSNPGGIWAGAFKQEIPTFSAEFYDETTMCPGDSMPVYRFLNNLYGSTHFYTISETEKSKVETNSATGGIWAGAFKYEKVAYCAYDQDISEMNLVPVYRFLNNQLGSTHFYTASQEEKDKVINNIAAGGVWEGAFKYEGIAFYAMPFSE